jgi:hypothetical protein
LFEVLGSEQSISHVVLGHLQQYNYENKNTLKELQATKNPSKAQLYPRAYGRRSLAVVMIRKQSFETD